MQPLNLYTIDIELAEIEAALVDAGGEIDEDLDQRYNDLLDARDDKHRSYVAVIRRLEASAEAVKQERQRLQERERAFAASAKRLKDRLCESMLAAGEDVAETPIGKVRVQYGPAPIVLDDADVEMLPERFLVRSVSADRRAIADALKAGDSDVEGLARYGERSPYLRIY